MKPRRTVRHKTKRKSVFTENFKLKYIDKSFLLLVFFLSLLGLFMIYDASVVVAHTRFDDAFYFVKHQALWFLVGMTCMFISLLLPITWWQRNSRKFMYATIILLVAVFLGEKTLGARRWLNIAGFSLQPSELAKLTLVLYLSNYINRAPIPLYEFLKTVGLVLILVILQPDLGTSLVIAGSSMVIYWISGAPLKHFVWLGSAGFLAVLGLIMTSSYRFNRLMTFLDPNQDPLGTSYHVRQILISLGLGGWNGVGLGQSIQKFYYLPEVANDSIFAIFAEETGLIGGIIFITLFLILFLRGIKIATQAPSTFGRLCAIGLISGMAIQTFINLSAMTILVPLTGITLPLISYGGTSLVTTLTSIGIILNISTQSSLLNRPSSHRPR